HRFGLFDMFLIKENHIRSAGSLSEAILLCRAFAHHKKIEVETTNLSEVKEAVAAAPDIIMLDNMNDKEILEAALYIRDKSSILIEASGNMTLERLRGLRNHPLDFISMGSLIHSAKALDLSFLITN
ncbi:MAG: nicotinate-nucleotide diphosphorylase (carboxylating), partial [Spirochaetae bacterium HGW-Spirochaetae-6]